MRNLEAKLAMLSSAQPKPPAAAPVDCYDREVRYPLEADTVALLRATLGDILSIDPGLALHAFDPGRVLFLDTETTGLSGGVGTVPFLVGLGWIEADGFVLRQLMLRNYAQEPFLLEKLCGLLGRFELIVTYNGKTFDLPLLHSRLVLHRFPRETFSMAHLDLLHPTRAVYKLRLKRCTLQHIEQEVLHFNRPEDLPGSEVPQRFFDFLKTGEMALLDDVLRHNDQDIRSLAVLLAKLITAYHAPEQLGFSQDVFSVGRVLERRGHREEARRCFHVAARGAMGERARSMLAGSHKRDAQYALAEGIYLQMLSRGEGGTLPYVELAKYLEHKKRDWPRALAYTRSALQIAKRAEDMEQIALLEKRQTRLQRKIEKTKQ